MMTSRLLTLPKIMLAPNGARLKKIDHRSIPLTIAETVETAKACFAVGAQAIHAHVRDELGQHLLDVGLYRELIAEMAQQVPDMPVQITTEAIGQYSPDQQRKLLTNVECEGVSIALREMFADDDIAAASRAYHQAVEAGVAVQHILYLPSEAQQLADFIADGTIPKENLQLLFVLGRYTPGIESQPADIEPFLEAANKIAAPFQWAVCCFGRAETDCLVAALAKGGNARIGFENNVLMPDGSTAPDNAARVENLVQLGASYL